MRHAVWALALGTLAAAAPALAEDTATEWKSRAELSYVRTTGNTETDTFAGKVEASADATPNRYFASAAGLYGKTGGVVTSSRWTLAGRFERALSEKLFGFVAADYLKDTYAGYDARVTVGPGAGYDFLTGPAHTLKGLASVLYVVENIHAVPEPSDDSESYASGKLEGKYGWQINEEVKFRQNADFSLSFEDSDVYFANSETGLEVQLRANLALGLTYLVAYQHEPPSGAKHTDTTFLTSLVVDF